MDKALTGAVIVLGLLAAGAASAAPAGGGPFAFTGAHLGMSLDSWRAMPFPGQKDPRAAPACSGDPGLGAEAELAPTPAQRRAGAVVCGYIARFGRYTLPQGIRPGPGRAPVMVRYVFVDGRLSQIRYQASGDAFDKVTARLQAAYGPPHAVLRDEMKTEIGDIDRVHMTWTSPSGSTVLTDPSDAHLDLAVVLSGPGPQG